MKNRYLIFTLLASLILAACHKEDDLIKEPKVTETSVEIFATQATFSWSVDWLGRLNSVVELSENADMSASRYIGSDAETENHEFSATATGLKPDVKYYYRYVVWNRNYENDKFLTEIRDVTMLELLEGGMVTGVFSVSPATKVYFSQGNLQYRTSDGKWRFAERQYDCIGDANSNISSSYDGWIDLFGWGTSGWNSGATCYQPWSTNMSESDYYPGGSYTNNLTGNYANADWGVYNAISNGDNQAGLWRTLTMDEWVYVFNTRGTASGIRYAKACVNSQNGVILLPDDWSASYYTLNSTNSTGAGFTSNTISAAQWTTLEQHGAVFLPAAGSRWYGTSVYDVGSCGYYWSVSCHRYAAYYVSFSDSRLNPRYEGSRYSGQSVRLVRSAQ